MKHKKILVLAAMALVFACAGCGRQAQQAKKEASDPLPQTQDTVSDEREQEAVPSEADPAALDDQDKESGVSEAADGENPPDGDGLFELGDLSGTVTAFSETGCTLSPSIEGGEGEIHQAAPGYEDILVSVVYDPDCTFQTADVDLKTGSVAYEPAAAADVKEQASLIACGEYDENDVFHASRIFLYIIEGL